MAKNWRTILTGKNEVEPFFVILTQLVNPNP